MLPALDVLIVGGDWLVLDVIVVRKEARYEHDVSADPPTLAVEINLQASLSTPLALRR